MAKSDNLLAILWLLRSRKRMTAGEIAAELEVDVRTVYRYIDALSASGAPVVAEPGPNGGYQLLDTFRETPLFFSRSERVALAHAALFAQKAGYPYSASLTAALQKMEHYMSPEQVENLHLHVAGLVVIDTAESADPVAYEETTDAERSMGSMTDVLKQLENAVASARTLSIVHVKDGWQEPLRRTVRPYGLIYWRENWYLVAYCLLRNDLRMFRCDRLFEVEESGETFIRPPGFSAREFFLHAMIPNEARTDEPTVELTGKPWAIEHISHHWFVRHFIHSREPSRLRLALTLERALDTLPEIIIGYGVALDVETPLELRGEIAAFARSVSDRFNATRPHGTAEPEAGSSDSGRDLTGDG